MSCRGWGKTLKDPKDRKSARQLLQAILAAAGLQDVALTVQTEAGSTGEFKVQDENINRRLLQKLIPPLAQGTLRH
eukprot:3849959-Prorocentrum_lima.AAC.1